MLALRDGDVPQTILMSYADDEQSGKNKLPIPFPLYYDEGPSFE
jgi:hypothetical protein